MRAELISTIRSILIREGVIPSSRIECDEEEMTLWAALAGIIAVCECGNIHSADYDFRTGGTLLEQATLVKAYAPEGSFECCPNRNGMLFL